ncbi:hypothetical protein HK097_010689 [Rhizophlyctis rosea]|uniref:Cryptic loci regulator 2 N-terminal domain-containing protein n=1 Tax=Rhizophlyctis rosea TaxID=64517 RepID=A0AAD5X2E2_9FUNG|nr:hypothetical protein HK097_010689 [Rhizophlyctis rosea]
MKQRTLFDYYNKTTSPLSLSDFEDSPVQSPVQSNGSEDVIMGEVTRPPSPQFPWNAEEKQEPPHADDPWNAEPRLLESTKEEEPPAPAIIETPSITPLAKRTSLLAPFAKTPVSPKPQPTETDYEDLFPYRYPSRPTTATTLDPAWHKEMKQRKRKRARRKEMFETLTRLRTSTSHSRPVTPRLTVDPKFSDGDPALLPKPDPKLIPDDKDPDPKGPSLWLPKLGLKDFPYGYCLFALTRGFSADGTRKDMYLYGHPSGARFRSPAEFIPHLDWLAGGDPTAPCKCIYCNKKGYKRPSNVTWAEVEEESGESGASQTDSEPMDIEPDGTNLSSLSSSSSSSSEESSDVAPPSPRDEEFSSPTRMPDVVGQATTSFEEEMIYFNGKMEENGGVFKTESYQEIAITPSRDTNGYISYTPPERTADQSEYLVLPDFEEPSHPNARKDDHWLTPRSRSHAALKEENMEETDPSTVLAPFSIPPAAVFPPPNLLGSDIDPSTPTSTSETDLTSPTSRKRRMGQDDATNKIPRVSMGHRAPHPIPESKAQIRRRRDADRCRGGEVVWCTAGGKVLGVREERTFARWPALVVDDGWCRENVEGWVGNGKEGKEEEAGKEGYNLVAFLLRGGRH